MLTNDDQKTFDRLLEVRNLQFYAKFFLSLCKTKNLTKTANFYNVDKSLVSKYLKKLENLIQTTLFIRKGRKGLIITENGLLLQEFFEKIKKLVEGSQKLITNKTTICVHILAFKRYIMPVLKELEQQNNGARITFCEYSATKAIQKLQDDLVDAIFFPFDTISISKIDQQKFNVIKFNKYHLCVYLSKNNKYANLKESKLTWSILKELNVCPITTQTSFNPYYDLLHEKKCQYIASTTNINTLYYGAKEGWWSIGIGEEIEDYIDCSMLAKKRSDKTDLFKAQIYWYFCYKKENKEKLKYVIQALKILRKNKS